MNYFEKLLLKICFVLLFIVSIYKIKGILLPFIVGFIIAFLFKNIVRKYENKISRGKLSLIIISSFSAIVVGLSIVIFPSIISQLFDLLAETIKDIQNIDKNNLYTMIDKALVKFRIEEIEGLQNCISNLINLVLKSLMNLANSFLLSSIQIINILLMICISPIVAFYFLKDWDKMFYYIENCLLPKNYRKDFQNFSKQIDDVMHHYLVGQAYVCFIFCIFYFIILRFMNINYSLILGILSGIAVMFPYIGAFGSATVALIITYFQFGFDIKKLFIVLFFYCFGQFIEGNFVTPSIIGNKMQVHPMWLLFGILSLGSLFGIWGMLLSMPICGAVSVLIKFIIERKNNEKMG